MKKTQLQEQIETFKSQMFCIYGVDKKFFSSKEKQILSVFLFLGMEGEDCICPSYKMLSGYTGVSPKTIMRYVESLEKRGFIRKTIRKQERKTKAFMTNLYHINFETLKTCQRRRVWAKGEKRH